MSANPTNTATKPFFSQDLITLPPSEREIVSLISSDVILNDQITSALTVVQSMLASNSALSEKRHALLLGESGCGKTTVLDILRKEFEVDSHPNVFALGQYRKQRMVVLTLPSHITPKSLTQQLLMAYGVTTNLNATCFELTQRAIEYISRCQTEIVVCDEYQHLLALGSGGVSGQSTRLREAQNWMKGMLNATTASFLVVGVPEIFRLVENHEQLSRRFTHIHTLEPLPPPSDKCTDLVDFVDGLLMNAATELPYFEDMEYLANSPENARKIYTATTGSPTRIKDLVIAAALAAHREGSKKITMKNFESAYELSRHPYADIHRINQLTLSRSKIRKALEESGINPITAHDTQIDAFISKLAA